MTENAKKRPETGAPAVSISVARSGMQERQKILQLPVRTVIGFLCFLKGCLIERGRFKGFMISFIRFLHPVRSRPGSFLRLAVTFRCGKLRRFIEKTRDVIDGREQEILRVLRFRINALQRVITCTPICIPPSPLPVLPRRTRKEAAA